MKKLILLCLSTLFIVSCSNEYKADRYIKNMTDGYVPLFKDVSEETAEVYYTKDYTYYKYDVVTKKSSQIFKLEGGQSSYLYDNCNLGRGDVFYLTDQRQVMRYNLKTKTERCLNKYNDVSYEFVAGWNQHLLFYNNGEDVACDERIRDYNTQSLTSRLISFDNIDNEYTKYFVPTLLIGHHGLIIILTHINGEDGLDLSNYLYHYHYHCGKLLSGSLDLLCQSDRIWLNNQDEKLVILAEKDINTVATYDLYGKLVKEFHSLYGWQEYRGLPSGNVIARSREHNILCYIASDDNNFISSIYLYYYDANTGEEVKLNKFVKPSGEEVVFVVGERARKHIYVAEDNVGLVFYGETDWLSEYALLYFDFETRTTQVIDRGVDVSFTRDRFRVEHHNGTVQWYNTSGQETQPRSVFGEMGAELGGLINLLF